MFESLKALVKQLFSDAVFEGVKDGIERAVASKQPAQIEHEHDDEPSLNGRRRKAIPS